MKQVEFIEKEKRNKSIYQFRLNHPGMTLEAIGKVYHINKSRVSAIIAREKIREKDALIKSKQEGKNLSPENLLIKLTKTD